MTVCAVANTILVVEMSGLERTPRRDRTRVERSYEAVRKVSDEMYVANMGVRSPFTRDRLWRLRDSDASN